MGELERIAILCGGESHHDYLVARIASRWPVELLVREPEIRQRERVKARALKRSSRWARYHAIRRKLFGLDRFRRRYFEPLIVAAGPHSVAATLTVADINGQRAVSAVRAVRPQLTLVMGTSILGREMLEAAGGQIVNVHGGLLPYYRGNHCVFFALYEDRPDRVGATIHFVDPGVDTGPIIEAVQPADVSPTELPESAYCRAVHAAVDRLVIHLERLDEGIPLPSRPQPRTGRIFRTRDRRLGHELRHWWKRARRRPGGAAPDLAPAGTPVDLTRRRFDDPIGE